MASKINNARHYCERLFLEGGPFFHLHTKPLQTRLLFRDEEELNLALNLIALAVYASGVRLLAFAIMNNHLHFILEGSWDCCLAFYQDFQRRLTGVYFKKKRAADVKAAEPGFTPISSLLQLRDEIAYVVRNPFVAAQNVHLFSYKWCSGYLYFNGIRELLPKGIPATQLSYNQKRAFKHERGVDLDERIRVLDGVALASSFTDYERAMSFFENSRQFVHWLLKNVESQVSIAKRLGETITLDDTELWSVVYSLCRDTYHVPSPKELTGEALATFRRTLKYDYNASNAQIARCTGASPAAIDEMFPLNAR